MPPRIAQRFGTLLGTSLSGVRLHHDASSRDSAAALGARAYTVGEHIFLGPSAPGLDSPAGHQLLAHELIHVAQNRNPGPGRSSLVTPRDQSSEVEARAGASRLLAGHALRPRQTPSGLAQREEEGNAPADATPASASALGLDQDVLQSLRAFLASWLADQWGGGSIGIPLAALASPPGVNLLQPPGLSLYQAYQFGTATPDYLAPLPPDPTYRPPDFSALYGPHNTRGVPSANRDSPDFMESLYRPRWQLVAGLPDLRGMAPSFLRDVIPTTWRVDLASALTGLTADSQLKGDFPTAIDVADRALVNMTGDMGAAPTYINPPFPPFKWSF